MHDLQPFISRRERYGCHFHKRFRHRCAPDAPHARRRQPWPRSGRKVLNCVSHDKSSIILRHVAPKELPGRIFLFAYTAERRPDATLRGCREEQHSCLPGIIFFVLRIGRYFYDQAT